MKAENEEMTLRLLKEMEALLSTLHDEPIRLALITTAQTITTELIKTLISVGFGLEWKVIIQGNKRTKIIFARMSFCYLCKNYTLESDGEIGRIIKRDRTTVLANRQTIGNLFLTQDPCVYPFLNPIINHLNSIENATKKVQN